MCKCGKQVLPHCNSARYSLALSGFCSHDMEEFGGSVSSAKSQHPLLSLRWNLVSLPVICKLGILSGSLYLILYLPEQHKFYDLMNKPRISKCLISQFVDLFSLATHSLHIKEAWITDFEDFGWAMGARVEQNWKQTTTKSFPLSLLPVMNVNQITSCSSSFLGLPQAFGVTISFVQGYI